jgi:hypothetical protein
VESSWALEACEEVASLLPPSGGPTQAGTTPSPVFRAMLEPHSESVIEVTL